MWYSTYPLKYLFKIFHFLFYTLIILLFFNKCSPNCDTCISNSANCITCKNDSDYTFLDIYTKICLSSCPSNTYVVNNQCLRVKYNLYLIKFIF